MGNIAPRVGIESTFQASVLTITPPRLPDYTTLSVYAAPAYHTGLSGIECLLKGRLMLPLHIYRQCTYI